MKKAILWTGGLLLLSIGFLGVISYRLIAPVGSRPLGTDEIVLWQGYEGGQYRSAKSSIVFLPRARQLDANLQMGITDSEILCWNAASNKVSAFSLLGVHEIKCPKEWSSAYGRIQFARFSNRIYARVPILRSHSILYKWYSFATSDEMKFAPSVSLGQAILKEINKSSNSINEFIALLDNGASFDISEDLRQAVVLLSKKSIRYNDFSSGKSVMLEPYVGLGSISSVGLGPRTGEFLYSVSMPTGLRGYIAIFNVQNGDNLRLVSIEEPVWGPLRLISSKTPVWEVSKRLVGAHN
jgi:hypothetical protein